MSGKQDAWEIAFEMELVLPPYHADVLSVKHTGEKTYLFETTDQKYLLHYLSQLPVKIAHIRNKVVTLDDLFDEVCK